MRKRLLLRHRQPPRGRGPGGETRAAFLKSFDGNVATCSSNEKRHDPRSEEPTDGACPQGRAWGNHRRHPQRLARIGAEAAAPAQGFGSRRSRTSSGSAGSKRSWLSSPMISTIRCPRIFSCARRRAALETLEFPPTRPGSTQSGSWREAETKKYATNGV